MKINKLFFTVLICLFFIMAFNLNRTFSQSANASVSGSYIKLSQPKFSGNVSVEEALLKRRSMRDYKGEAIPVEDLSQLLWAAQGITDSAGHRTAPSAGADYPLALYVVAGNVTGLQKGLYKYIPKGHQLSKVADGDIRSDIYKISIDQLHILNAAFLIIYTEDKNISKIYAQKSVQKVNTEIGAALQNVFLQGAALDLGVAVSTSWNELKLKSILKLGSNFEPLIIQTIGKQAKRL
jgi:SagB-type dehydrogenase family enzyme